MERLKQVNIKNIAVFFLLIGITFIVMMQSPLDLCTENGITGTDSSVFRYVGWMMTEGYVPYRDYFDHKGILLYVINFLGMLLSFEHGVWFLEGITIFISAFLCYKIAEKRCGFFCGAAVTVFIFALMNQYFDGGNFTEEYALPFQLGALYIFLDYFIEEKISKLRLSVCGACFAAVCLLRINMVSIWFVFCIMVLIQCLYQKRTKELGKFLGYFILGGVLFSLPFAIYLMYHHALFDFIEQYIIFNQMYAGDATYVTAQGKWEAFLFFGKTLAFLAAFVYIILSLVQKERRYFHIGYLCYMIITLLLVCMSGQIYRHYGMTLLPALIYPYCLMGERFLKTEGKKKVPYLAVAGCLFVAVALFNWRILCINTYWDLTHTNVYEDQDLREVVSYIQEHTTEDEKISVYGNRDVIYNLSDRQSVSKYSYQTPVGKIKPEIMEAYYEELEETKPKLIIVARESDEEIEGFLQENNYEFVESHNVYQIYQYRE